MKIINLITLAACSIVFAGGLMSCNTTTNNNAYDEATTVFMSGADDLANSRVHTKVQGYASSNLRSGATAPLAVGNLTNGAVSEGQYIIANTTGGDTKPWFAVDLGEVREINKIRIVAGAGQHADGNYEDAFPTEYKVQYAEETADVESAAEIATLTWNTIEEVKDATLATRSITFTNKSARYVRVQVEKYFDQYCALLELNVYGPDKTKALSELGKEINILFIGNSITYYNNVWSQFEAIALSKGHNVHSTACVYGGKSIEYHSTSHNAETAIKAGNYDYVVLQDNCSNFNTEKLLSGSEVIIPKIKQYSPNAKIVYYQTWTKQDSRSRAEEYIQGYLSAAKEYGDYLAPVGEAFYDLCKTRNFEYYDDGLHSQPTGSFLAASTIYYSIFLDEEPLKLTNKRYNYINTLINANVSDCKNGISETYGSDVIALCDSLAHQYAHAVLPALKDTTGEVTYTSVSKTK